jgi:hypothetical protein
MDDLGTAYWVEPDGEPISRFGDVDYACGRAQLLAAQSKRMRRCRRT